MTPQELTRALAAAASHVRLEEAQRRRILRRTVGVRSRARRLRLALALALALALLAAAALAVGTGVFSALSSPDNRQRLTRVDEVSQAVADSVALPAVPQAAPADDTLAARLQAEVDAWAFTLTLDRAYCDGHRLYFAYTLAASRPARTILGEGAPTGFTAWDVSRPGKTFRQLYRARSEQTGAIADHLDAHPAAYAVQESFSLGDGVRLQDGQGLGTVLAIQDSAVQWADDCTLTGFVEVLLPQPATGEVAFTVSLNRGATVYYQDASGLYEAGLGWDAIQRIPFTVSVGGTSTGLAGAADFTAYSARASLLCSQVDVSGTVLLACPDAWLLGWDHLDEPGGVPCVGSYRLQAGTEFLDSQATAVQVTPEGHLLLSLRFDLPSSAGSWSLIPLYTDGRAAPEEAISLQ